jgi:type I restriction enzyme S subunit
LEYLLSAKHFCEQIILKVTGTAQFNISSEQVEACLITLPPLVEQRAIAGLLDREIGKIDALVEEQRRLIELLKEKRQAAISHAVTKGLNPFAPMKDSGIGWPGQVPESWEIYKFSREVRIAGGQVDPKVEPYASMILIGPERVESKTGKLLQIATAADQAAESGKYLCRKGDVVYSKIRPALAKVVMAPEECLCSADMYPLSGGQKIKNAFLYWFLLSDWFSAWSVSESDRVAMPKINRETVSKLFIPTPSPAEQDCIAQFLATETKVCDELTGEATRAIDLLQERRTALISAAVTGKIDVRGLAMKDVSAFKECFA